MYEVFNNCLCVYANDLIRHNPKRGVGSEKGFLAEGTYNYKVSRGLLVLMRRSSQGKPALIEYMTMEEDVKRKYIDTYGDPMRESKSSSMGLLESTMKYNEAAYTYFSTEYRDELGRKLSADKASLYTLQARVLDACLYLAGEKKREIGGGNTRIDVWGKLSDMVNDLATIRNNQGELRYIHKLPSNGKSLRRKADQYSKEGWSALIHKNRGNRNAVKVQDYRAEAVMHKLLSQHMNLNNVQIMEKYNEVAGLMQMPIIKSPVTVDKYRKQMEATTLAHQKGLSKMRNTLEMQVKRSAPTTALTYWTLDGWTVELLYQKKVEVAKMEQGEAKRYKKTTYWNRKTMVVVLDACTQYPIGYAIGDQESTSLIREALRNATRHCRELFGKRYKPMQIQSDHYGRGTLTPFYEAMTRYYTPAAVHNAKAKIIEPYFNHLNRAYCQMCQNWSGFNISASKDNQPNLEILNRNHKCIPDEEGVIAQINEFMAKERASKVEAYMKAFECTPDERKVVFKDEEYLLLMGESSGRTNRLTGQGLMIEMMGERINYESFNMELRNHYNEDWMVRYDPEDLSQVLITNAVATKGHRVKEEKGDLSFVMQRTMKIPMALADQKPEHFEYRKAVKEFNAEFERRYVEKQQEVDETIYRLREEFPMIGQRNSLLDRALITDSRGQHKDNRSKEREEVEDAFILEESTRRVFVPSADEDDDYEFNPTDMNFSR